MGHNIHPIRYRYGKTMYWANNWPVFEKKRANEFYGFHKELEQFFRSLFYYTRPVRLIRKRKQSVYSRDRRPNIYYSHLNLNVFGFKLDKLILDVNIFDYFLESQIETHLTELNTNYASFFKRFKSFFTLDFYLRYKKVFKKTSKNRYQALIFFRRKRYSFMEKIFREKIKVFFDFYCQLIQRSFFSFFSDQNQLLNKKYLLGSERRVLQNLPFRYRKLTIKKYWNIKYQNILNNPVISLNDFFAQYYTGNFRNYIEKIIKDKRGREINSQHQNLEIIKKKNFQVVQNIKKNTKLLEFITQGHKNHKFTKTELQNFIQQEHFKNKKDKTFLLLYQKICLQSEQEQDNDVLMEEWTENFLEKGALEELLIKEPISIYKQQEKTHVDKLIQILGKNRYIRLLQNKKDNQNEKFILYTNHLQDNFENFNEIQQKLSLITTNDLKKNIKQQSTNIKIKNFIERTLTLYYDLKQIAKNEFLNLNSDFNNLNFLLDDYIQKLTKNKSKNLIKKTLNFNKKIYKTIDNFIKKKSQMWYQCKLDPFYQQYMKLKQFKTLILNINVGLGEPSDHLDARFIVQYIKKLFVRKKPLWEIYRTMFKTLRNVDYLDGFLIVFSGRFTRSEYATFQLKKKGILSFGNISKLIDYQTIGFVGKFGYCGIKVYLQYKSNLPYEKNLNSLLQKQLKERNQERKERPLKFHTIKEKFTNQKMITNHIMLKDPSKKLKRVLQDTITKSNVPYYNNDQFLIK